MSISFNTTEDTPSIRFLASLSDGRTVIEDIKHGEKSAWFRLRDFLKDNPNIKITCLRLQGSSGLKTTPSNQAGYAFGNKFNQTHGGKPSDYVGIGYYDGNKVHIQWHRKPNFDHSYMETRTPEKAGFFLIKNG